MSASNDAVDDKKIWGDKVIDPALWNVRNMTKPLSEWFEDDDRTEPLFLDNSFEYGDTPTDAQCLQLKKWGVVDLFFNGNYFKEVPSSLFDITTLVILDLDENRLKFIPPEIGQLTELKKCWLSYNKLTELPNQMANLTKLTRLCISGNKITHLPDWLADLPELKKLECGPNPLLSPQDKFYQYPDSYDPDESDGIVRMFDLQGFCQHVRGIQRERRRCVYGLAFVRKHCPNLRDVLLISLTHASRDAWGTDYEGIITSSRIRKMADAHQQKQIE